MHRFARRAARKAVEDGVGALERDRNGLDIVERHASGELVAGAHKAAPGLVIHDSCSMASELEIALAGH